VRDARKIAASLHRPPVRNEKDRNQNEVNFDAVQEQLIVPALERVGVDGRTTLDILRAGNIRVDMFQRLLTADLVVADLSIDNANVFTRSASATRCARSGPSCGDLELLGVEARGLEWESEGLRVVGRAQFRLKAFKGARATWEAVRKFDPNDREANTLLGTIYQRLGDLTRSDQALRRVLERKDVASYDRAEVHSLLGRNAKIQWKADWERLPAEQRRQRALRSGFLEDSFKAYAGAFSETSIIITRASTRSAC
jgi:tetratricopeptide (TPR) repeat protein